MQRPTATLKDLVQGFAANIRGLKSPEYKESQLRLHYLDPFWKLLGWDVSNDDQLPLGDVDVLIEPSMDSVESDGVSSRKPDYLFRISGFPRFIVEAKKPAIDIDADKKAIYQAKRRSCQRGSRNHIERLALRTADVYTPIETRKEAHRGLQMRCSLSYQQ